MLPMRLILTALVLSSTVVFGSSIANASTLVQPSSSTVELRAQQCKPRWPTAVPISIVEPAARKAAKRNAVVRTIITNASNEARRLAAGYDEIGMPGFSERDLFADFLKQGLERAGYKIRCKTLVKF